MGCPKRMSMLNPPLTTIFGIIFVLVSLMATLGNGFILYILWKPTHSSITRTSRILTSLAVSDLLVGLILSPVTAWQVLNTTSLSSCNADYVRRYFTVLLVGSSVMTLAFVSYDRYILLTKLNNYSLYMTRRKIISVLVLIWFIPAIVPLTQFEVFGPHLYLSLVVMVFFLPMLVLIASYTFIVKAIKEKQEILKKHSCGMQKISQEQTSSDSKLEVSVSSSKKMRRDGKKHIQLGKAVAVLICCYAVCMTPINIWIPINLINSEYHFVDLLWHQIFYLIAMLMSQINSCCNPVIYFMKNPEFRKAVRRLLKPHEASYTESSNEPSAVIKSNND